MQGWMQVAMFQNMSSVARSLGLAMRLRGIPPGRPLLCDGALTPSALQHSRPLVEIK
jgi:hypothetical protein